MASKAHESRDMYVAEEINDMVLTWSLVELLLICLVAIAQIAFVKRIVS